MRSYSTPLQDLRNQAMALRQLATGRDAMEAIGRESCFNLAGVTYHNVYTREGAPDRCVPHPITGQVLVFSHEITPMDLIDDACAFEAIASKLETRK